MLRIGKAGILALSVCAALGVTLVVDSFDLNLGGSLNVGQATAQDGGNRGNRGNRGNWGAQDGNRGNRGNWGGQDGNRGNRGNWGGQDGNRGNRGNWGGPGGNRGQGGSGGIPPQFQSMIDNMTQEQFDRWKSGPFAERAKQMIPEKWAQWERGEFGNSSAADDAAKAAAKAEGTLEEVPELTEEEKRDAEQRLRAGTVPEFVPEGETHYSTESEAEFFKSAMSRRTDVLIESAPLTLRYYVRHLMDKYDANSDGTLQRVEWENRIEGAQAMDLNGDWDLSDQEILFYLARFAKDRTIFNPNPVRAANQRLNFIADAQDRPTMIRPASAAPRRLNEQEAHEARLINEGETSLAQLSDEEVRGLFTADNPALESVQDEETLDALLTDMNETSVREYAAPAQALKGAPLWFLARDLNGDGQLSILEFTPNLSQQHLALFGRYDSNDDHLITVEEARKGPTKK